MSFVFDALTHPTGHNRSVQNPAFPGTNGVPHDFGLDIPLVGGALTTNYDNGLNYNNGVNSTNQPITKQFAQRQDGIWNSSHSGVEQLVFTSGKTSNVTLEATNYIVSLYALNHYLRTDPNARRRYANDNLFTLFNDDWCFAGVQKSKEQQESLISTNTRYITVTTGKRAQIPDICRAMGHEKYNRKGTVSENDVVWLTPRRYEDNYKDYPVYHQIDVYPTRSRMQPNLGVTQGYLNDGSFWLSVPIRLGFVSLVHGAREFNSKQMNQAREAVKGNNGDITQRWEDLQSLGRIELMLAIAH